MGQVKDLKRVHELFMREHRMVFRALALMPNAKYRSDDRRERIVSFCREVDAQRLTFNAYTNKKLVCARPMAQPEIGIKNMTHLTGLVKANHI